MIKVGKETINEAVALRHELHRFPETAGEEKDTANRIINHLKQFHPEKIITGIGGYGVAAIFQGTEEGPVILFRCELDALSIAENLDIPYQSKNEGVSHKCGHDGHMAIMVGLGRMIYNHSLKRGKVILLFQPAEEVGEGAEKVISDGRIRELKPDFIFGLHNLPGYRHGRIIIRKETFAAASKGIIIRLKGRTSHAAHPENGLSPVFAVTKLIDGLDELSKNKRKFKDYKLITVVHVKIGEVAFGTAPGEGVIMGTLRAFEPEDMELLVKKAEQLAVKIAKKYKLQLEIIYTEEFPVTKNNEEAYSLMTNAMKTNGINTKRVRHPFRWSDDFGRFSELGKSFYFGLGSGLNQHQLHHSSYDFPDEIIEPGINAFYSIVDHLLNKDIPE